MGFYCLIAPRHGRAQGRRGKKNRNVFSGIIEDLGTVRSLKPTDKGALITIGTRLPAARIKVGDSIACNGACLTVVAKGRGTLSMDVSAETLRRTALGALKPADPINLERSLTLGTLLNGHLVSGHVDGVGRIVATRPEGDSCLFTFEVAPEQARYLVEKGSVAVDGISLTVFGVKGRRFTCALIPHTLKMTTLGRKRPGDAVNIESDLLAKYIERFVSQRNGGRGAKAR
jgi:riboflavin synthase